ncbi:hypothetical protein [Actinophytocola sediminis]
MNFNPDNDRSGLWVEGTDAPGGESGGIFMNGNTMCVWSPGDNDLLKIFDEDSLPAGTPVLRITGTGAIVHRTTQIHADYVFEPDYPLESIEEHAEAMMSERRLRGIPRRQQDESGQPLVDYGSFMRGLLEELEKAHLYIAKLSGQLTGQQAELSRLSARVEAQPAG